MSSEDNYFPLDEDSYRRFQQLEKKTPPPSPSKKNGGEKSAAAEPWKANPPLAVDPGDVQVLFRAEKEEGPGEVTSTFRIRTRPLLDFDYGFAGADRCQVQGVLSPLGGQPPGAGVL